MLQKRVDCFRKRKIYIGGVAPNVSRDDREIATDEKQRKIEKYTEGNAECNVKFLQ
jgi:hypothetical protein